MRIHSLPFAAVACALLLLCAVLPRAASGDATRHELRSHAAAVAATLVGPLHHGDAPAADAVHHADSARASGALPKRLRNKLTPQIVREEELLMPHYLADGSHPAVGEHVAPPGKPFVPQPNPYSPTAGPCTTYARQDNCVGNPPLRPDALPPCAGFAGPVPANVSLFGVIGDYGIDGNCLFQVAELVNKVQQQFGYLEFLVTTGDNAYWTGTCSGFESTVKQYYSTFLPTNGTEPCTDPMKSPPRGFVNPHWADMKHFQQARQKIAAKEKADMMARTEERHWRQGKGAAGLPVWEDAATASASSEHRGFGGRSSKGAPNAVRFYPSMGNHDWDTYGSDPLHMPYFQFFDYLLDLAPSELAHGQFYQTRTSIPGVELFALNSNLGSPSATPLQQDLFADQVAWLQAALGNSTAPFKLVYFHHPPHCTAQHDPLAPWMDLPFEEWGATAVFAGHEHVYERLLLNRARRDTGAAPAVPYIVNGLGGHPWTYSITGCPSYPGSLVRYNAFHGMQLGVVSWDAQVQRQRLDMCFYSLEQGGLLIDEFEMPTSSTVGAAADVAAAAAASARQ